MEFRKFSNKVVLFILVSGFLLFLTALIPSKANASVGLIEMRSTTAEDYRCFASSLLIQNGRYDVAINCVNLLFPVNLEQISTYIVWANPISGRGPLKIGDLQKGIVRFEIGERFSSLFVTSEANPNVRTPTNANIVMTGNVEPIRFLEVQTTPTPTPEVAEGEDGSEGQQERTPTQELTTREKLLLALRRAGIAAVIALIAIVGLVFVVTRSRG